MSAAPEERRERPRETAGKRDSRRRSLVEVVRGAVDQFEEVSGWPAERVTGARRDGDGWSVLVDVVELERIPSSTSVLATYRVDLDRDGQLMSYERLRRYSRSATDQS
jgi:Gas vesicle synthesis protein GvpO